MNSKRVNETSKFLSYVLRHEPQAIGLALDTEGWASIDALITAAAEHGRKLDRALIENVVSTNDKKRFSLSSDGKQIRAVQGHSTADVDIRFESKVPPAMLYHGTALRFLESIRQQGLKPGERQYVHLSENAETATAVGQRHGKAVVLSVAAAVMHQQGLAFYQAENGVWLTANVAPEFLDFGV